MGWLVSFVDFLMFVMYGVVTDGGECVATVRRGRRGENWGRFIYILLLFLLFFPYYVLLFFYVLRFVYVRNK